MNFHFIRPLVLLGLPIIILIGWLWRRAHDPLRSWRGVMDPELLDAMTESGGTDSSRRGIGMLLAWLLALFAVAGPTWKPEPSPFSDDPSPVMILLKADESMNRDDFSPSRMERARLKVIDFSEIRNGRPTGLIAYAGTAHLVLPPTRDTEVVGTMAEYVSPEIMPEPGNNLNAAIQLAEKILTETGGSIVVITDSASPYESNLPVHLLAVSRTEIKQAVMITADLADVETLDRKTKGSIVEASGDGKVRWSEAGYWFVPVLILFSLVQFRRDAE